MVLHNGVWDTLEHYLYIANAGKWPSAKPIPPMPPSPPVQQEFNTSTVTHTVGNRSIPQAVNDTVLPPVPVAPLQQPQYSQQFEFDLAALRANAASEELRRRVARLQQDVQLAEADKARAVQSLQSRLDTSVAREQNLATDRAMLEQRVKQLDLECQELRESVSELTERVHSSQTTRSQTTRDLGSTVPTSALSHDICEAQIAQLKSTIAQLLEQVQDWSERHAMVVTAYEATISDLSSKNVQQHLELDTSRDSEARLARQIHVSTHVALEEQRISMLDQFRVEQERLQVALREALAVKDAVANDLQRQLTELRAMSVRQQADKDQELVAMQRLVDGHAAAKHSLQQTHESQMGAMRDSLTASEQGRAALLAQVDQQRASQRRSDEVHRTQLQSMQEEHQALLQQLRTNQRQELDSLQQQHASDRSELEQRLQQGELRLAKAQTAHDTAVRSLCDAHAERVSEMSQRLASEMGTLNHQYQTAVRQLEVLITCIGARVTNISRLATTHRASHSMTCISEWKASGSLEICGAWRAATPCWTRRCTRSATSIIAAWKTCGGATSRRCRA